MKIYQMEKAIITPPCNNNVTDRDLQRFNKV